MYIISQIKRNLLQLFCLKIIEGQKWAQESTPAQGKLKELKKIPTNEIWVLWQLDELSKEINSQIQIDTEKLKSITNKEFLEMSKDQRLQYITKNKVWINQIISWEVKELEFTFTFDGHYNKELYMKTTIWQVVPQDVNQISVDWKVFNRESLEWEFFTSNHERLIIWEWVKVQILKLRNKDEISSIQSENQIKVEEFLKIHPEINNELVTESINRWIDPKFAWIVFWELVKNTPQSQLSQVLEDAFTEFDRVRWDISAWKEFANGRYDMDLTMTLLRTFNEWNWRIIAKNEFWYKEDQIKSVDDGIVARNDRLQKLWWISLKENADFMENTKTVAQEIEKVYWIPWKVTAWQAALESNWWKSKLTTQANNYFWIKSFWKWASVSFNSAEVRNWQTKMERSWFSVFSDMKEWFAWYAEFLIRNQRYRNAFKYAADISPRPSYYPSGYVWYSPEKFIQEIAKAWYATDPDYAQKVIQVWKRFDSIE